MAVIDSVGVGGPWWDPASWNGGVVPENPNSGRVLNGDTITVAAVGDDAVCAGVEVLGGLVVEAAKSLEVAAFTYNGAVLTFNGDILVNGNILGADVGAVSGVGTITQVGNGTVGWDTSIRAVPHLRLGWGGGVVSELTAHVKCNKFSHGAGTVTDLLNAIVLYVYAKGDDFWMAGTGTVKAEAVLIYGESGNGANTDKITVTADSSVFIAPASGETLTLNGGLDTGAAKIVLMSMVLDPAVLPIVDMGDGILTTTGAVDLGHDALPNQREVSWKLGTRIHWMGSLARSHANDTKNELHFETGGLGFTNTGLDGSGVKITSAGGRVVAGPVTNIGQDSGTLAGRLITWGCPTDAASIAAGAEHTPRQLGGMMPLAA